MKKRHFREKILTQLYLFNSFVVRFPVRSRFNLFLSSTRINPSGLIAVDTASIMTWEMHNALCKNGDIAGLSAYLVCEDRPIERECFYIGTINMTYRDHPQVAIAIGTRYIEEYYQTPEPFGPGHPPNGDILKRLVLLFDPFQYEGDEDYNGNRELAVWVCKFALAFGISDGTKGGFQGRLQNLEQALGS